MKKPAKGTRSYYLPRGVDQILDSRVSREQSRSSVLAMIVVRYEQLMRGSQPDLSADEWRALLDAGDTATVGTLFDDRIPLAVRDKLYRMSPLEKMAVFDKLDQLRAQRNHGEKPRVPSGGIPAGASSRKLRKGSPR